jgi:glutathione S-transferase
MPAAVESLDNPIIIGRSSSHFTRVTRIFAAELHVDYSFQVVRDLMSSDPADYGGNPALRLPILQTPQGTWFGALNICRELSRRSALGRAIVWPEHLGEPLPANAQELIVQAMATEVALIMAQLAGGNDGSAHQAKLRKSLIDTLSWLNANAARALASLRSDRDLSYLEVTLFCLVAHLEFRQILPTAPYPELTGFCQRFAARTSADQTHYRFDA